MKKYRQTIQIQMLLTVILAAFWGISVQGQQSGEIVYKREIDLGENKFFKDTLRFDGPLLLYIEKNGPQRWTTEEGYNVEVAAIDQMLYIDQRSLETIEQRFNYKKKRYELRKQTAVPYDWTIHNEYKTIGNYRVQKATVEHPDPKLFTVTAWFTPDIPVSGGPFYMWGLPGLIVEMSIYGMVKGRYIMESIILKPVGSLKPTEGVWVDEKGAPQTDKSALRDLLNKEGN
jgi:GLPGLI family protein